MLTLRGVQHHSRSLTIPALSKGSSQGLVPRCYSPYIPAVWTTRSCNRLFTRTACTHIFEGRKTNSCTVGRQNTRNGFAQVRTLNPLLSTPTQLSMLSTTVCKASTNTSVDSSNLSTPPHLQPYVPPTTGIISYLPSSWVPYAELARIDKPAGSYYLFFPCLFSTLLAGSYCNASPSTLLSTSALFAAGALIMRGAGCTVNDLWDRNLDPHVERTRLRPLARRAVTPLSATVFMGAQCLAGLGILLQFPHECLYWGIPSLLLVGTYPLAKRVTYYPQFVLGLTFSWGAFMGFPALGVDLLADQAARSAAALLYASCTAWTVLYDMIYAHMDIKDDKAAGIKSIALKHGHETKKVLVGLAAVQLGLLAGAGTMIGAGPAFFVGSCGGGALTLGTMIAKVNLQSVANCWWWFKYGAWWTGGIVSAGLLAEYVDVHRRKNSGRWSKATDGLSQGSEKAH